MAAPKIEVPNFENATPSFLVDELGQMSVMENYLKKKRKLFREVLDSKLSALAQAMGQEPSPDDLAHLLTGERFKGKPSSHQMTRVNQEYVKQHHPQETSPEYYTTQAVNTLRFESLTDPEINKWMDELRAELFDD